jgi:predicted outer membrane repeat protein
MRLFSAFPASERLPLRVLVASLYAALLGWGNLEAGTLIVTTTADNGAGSLRATIAAASDGDTIQFDPGLNGQTITLTSNELVIDKDITINGLGPGFLAVSRSASFNFGIIHIMPGHTVTVTGLTISGGHADFRAGGIWNEVNASLTISNCIVSNNFSEGYGGGILSDGTLTIVDSIVSNNRASYVTGMPFGYGGGIRAAGLTVIHSTISNNTAAIDGGGIIAGPVTISDSTISGNRAGSVNLQGTGSGGGLDVGGTVEIRNSTISGNIASGEDSGWGGGIRIGSSGPVTFSNSTISGNFANQNGGGISNGGPLTITNCTISGNTASLGGSIYNFGASALLEIGNTILKAGPGGSIANDNGGTVTSLGSSLSSDNGGGFLTAAGDQINTNPMLGPLQDNGGPTFTHNLLTGSPAIDAGNPSFTPPPDFDQRGSGFPRVFNGRIDIGSLEVQSTLPSPTPTFTPPTPTPTSTATGTPTATPTATPTPTATSTPSPTPTSTPAQALNISTRLRVETGDSVMIGGFIITGSTPKSVALRGIGPSLAGSGISNVLSDPTLELRDGSGALLFQNDDWQDNPAQAAQLTALGLALQDPRESGIVAALQPGAYTAILAGKDQTTGVGLVEVDDADGAATSQLANISTRGFVQTGDNVMIGGFILGGGNGIAGMAVRGIGPSLRQAGLSNVLADPTLELRDSNGILLIANDNWQDDQVSAAQLSAHGLAPQDPLEPGIFASLPPGAFTAILAGKNASTGIGLVEIYNVP